MSFASDNEQYEPLGGFTILITAASVEQGRLEAGALYEFTAHGGHACCRWDTTAATAADGGFTFAVAPGFPVRVRCPGGNTLLNVIEASADSATNATLCLARVAPA